MDKRFKRVYAEGTFSQFEVIVDTVTGINYLFHANGYAGGLTPLLDASGNPIVTPEYII